MVGRACLAAVFVLLTPLAAAAEVPLAEPGGFTIWGDQPDDQGPTLAFLAGGDLLQASPGLADIESCLRDWAPCTGPLVGILFDPVEPSLLTTFPVEPASEPRWPEETRIAVGAGDSFLAVWHERPYCNIRFGECDGVNGIMARLFLHPGSPGGPVAAVATVGDAAMHPAVAALRGGGFVAVWQSVGADAAGTSILGQRFDAAGNTVGANLPLALGATPGETPALAAGEDGSFLLAWTRPDAAAAPAGAPALFIRLFGADGTPAGDETRADAGAAGTPEDPALAAMASGFALVWSGAPNAVWTRRIDASGALAAAPVLATVATPDPADTANGPLLPAVASDATGGFFVVWQHREIVHAVGGFTQLLATYFGPSGEAPDRERQLALTRGFTTNGPRITSDGGYEYAVVWQDQLESVLPGFPAIHAYPVARYRVPGASCTPSGGSLCLGGGRFRIETR